MKASLCSSSALALAGIFTVFLMTVAAAPVETDEEQTENLLGPHGDADGDFGGGWDAVDAAALRKLLMQFDEDRLNIGSRMGRSWPQAEPRGLGLRQLRPLDGRVARQWRTDKRQVRFRQCYFNPISCFRK